MDVAVGMRVVGREPATVWRTLESLRLSGLPEPALFVDGPFGDLQRLAGYGPVTWRAERVGGWPSFLLALQELYLRNPGAGHYLLLEDDVLFCRDLAVYLERKADELELASLFTSARVERQISGRGIGFTRLNPGWNVASGSQALLFSNAVLEAFFASDFVRNYRRYPPGDVSPRHFRRDGLHHVDCAVGRFAYQAQVGIQYHYPSLSQHIGEESYM
jgi:hypothetical protein